MTPGRKLTEGCWTCRVRRKRCDILRPVCGNCQSLEIACHFDDHKPAWMDGAAEQKKMAQTIKHEIQHKSRRRKERRELRCQDGENVIELGTNNHASATRTEALRSLTVGRLDATTLSIREKAADDETSHTTANFSPEPMTGVGNPTDERTTRLSTENQGALSAIAILNDPIVFPASNPGPNTLNLAKKQELGFVMIYLDHVFPFLFPFYRPSLINTGRHWLLGLLCQDEVSFHTAACLSAYFFSIATQDGGQEMHENCKAIVWGQLVQQMDMALQSIQQDIAVINHRGVPNTLMESAQVLGSIVQFLITEITVHRGVDWIIHLTPALALFEELFKHHGTSSSQPDLGALLRKMPPPVFAMDPAHAKPLPYTADQSAFQFFSAVLLFIDTISSTALNQPPRLRDFHSYLLRNDQAVEIAIRLEEFFGCQNWVLGAISDIAALSARKEYAKRAGDLSMVDLVTRAGPILQALETGFDDLNANMENCGPVSIPAGRLGGYYLHSLDRADIQDSVVTTTKVWAYASKIYLSVVLSGWQPANAEVQDSVAKMLAILRGIDSPARLRSLSWPICVAGCLAQPHQEGDFCSIIDGMGALSLFGTITEARRIMEAVWRARATLDRDTWDVAACLRILGSPALLI